jgi:hypothetical protein
MARFDNGWVKIHRKAVLGDIGSNFTRGGLFYCLIAIANIQDSTVSWRGKPRKLARGEIVTSYRELSQLGEVDPKTVRRCLDYLVIRETIQLESCSNGTLIRILNYSKYQDVNQKSETSWDNDVDNDVPADGTMTGTMQGRMTGIHIEELKNRRKKEYSCDEAKIASPQPQVFPFDPFLDPYLQKISFKVQSGWLELYKDQAWILNEIKAGIVWCSANPQKAPKSSQARFFTNWLRNGWERYRKTIAANPSAPNLDDLAPLRAKYASQVPV